MMTTENGELGRRMDCNRGVVPSRAGHAKSKAERRGMQYWAG